MGILHLSIKKNWSSFGQSQNKHWYNFFWNDYIYVTRVEFVARHMGQSEDHTTQVPPSQKPNNIPFPHKEKNTNSTSQCYKVLIWHSCVNLHFWPKGMKYGQTKVTFFFALIRWGACCIISLINQNLYPYITFVYLLPLYNLLWLIIFSGSLSIVFLVESNVFSPNALSLTIIAY